MVMVKYQLSITKMDYYQLNFHRMKSKLYEYFFYLSSSELVVLETKPILEPEPVSPCLYIRCLLEFSSIKLFCLEWVLAKYIVQHAPKTVTAIMRLANLILAFDLAYKNIFKMKQYQHFLLDSLKSQRLYEELLRHFCNA